MRVRLCEATYEKSARRHKRASPRDSVNRNLGHTISAYDGHRLPGDHVARLDEVKCLACARGDCTGRGGGGRRSRDRAMRPHMKLVPKDDGIAPAVLEHKELELEGLLPLDARRGGAEVEAERDARPRQRLDRLLVEVMIHVDVARDGRPEETLHRLHVDGHPSVSEHLHAHGPHPRCGRQDLGAGAEALLLLQVVDARDQPLPTKSARRVHMYNSRDYVKSDLDFTCPNNE